MTNKIRQMEKEEGSIIVIFAFVLFVLIFFVGIAMDFGMMYMKKSDMDNLCSMARAECFTYREQIQYCENPGEVTYEVLKKLFAQNGFTGDFEMYFKEDYDPDTWKTSNSRSYKVRVILKDEYQYTFMRLFKQDKATLTASKDIEETFGDGSVDVIWHPKNVSYNGLYKQSPHFEKGKIPAGW